MKKIVLSKILKVLINSLISGIIFALFSIPYIVNPSLITSVLMAVPFILSMLYAYDCFLVKFPYILENNPMYIIETVLSIVGNIIGTMAIGGLLYATKIYESSNISIIQNTLNNLNHFEVLLQGLITGLLVYFGVNTYKKAEQPIARFLIIILCTMCAFYFNMSHFCFYTFMATASKFNGDIWGKVFSVLIGNSLGLILIPLFRKMKSKIG